MTSSRTDVKCALCDLLLPGRGRRGVKLLTGNIICVDCGDQRRKKCGLCGEQFSPTALKGTRFSYCLSCARSYSKSYNRSSKTIAGSLLERECMWCLQSFAPPSVRSKCCSRHCFLSHQEFVRRRGEQHRSSLLTVCFCGRLVSAQAKRCQKCRESKCCIDGCDDIVRSNGMCNAHVIRKRRGIDLTASRSELRRKPRCSFDLCERPKSQDDLCRFHLKRRSLGIPLDAPAGYRRSRPPKLCSHPGCEKKRHGLGLCGFHYSRKIVGRDLDAPLGNTNKYQNDICVLETCGLPHARKGYGLCKTHWNAKTRRRYKNGVHWLPLGERDAWVCHLCNWVVDQSAGTWKNRNGATVDHLIPRSKGGSDEWDNVRLAHYGCNHDRSDTDLELLNVEF